MKAKPEEKTVAPTRAGRPRLFDEAAALDKAVLVFWRHGYEGASLPALTKAMGINRPSLYAAFGNKESLFLKAVDRYAQRAEPLLADALAEPTARAFLSKLLHGSLDRTCREGPGGCLMVQGALACGPDAQSLKSELATRRSAVESLIRQRLRRARDEGDLPPTASAATLAKFYASLLHGLAVQSAGGAKPKDLHPVIDLALTALPS